MLTTTNTQDAGNKRKPEQTRTQSAMSEKNRRLAGAIAAYGKSMDVNKNKKRPASANVLTERSTWHLYLVYLCRMIWIVDVTVVNTCDFHVTRVLFLKYR